MSNKIPLYPVESNSVDNFLESFLSRSSKSIHLIYIIIIIIIITFFTSMPFIKIPLSVQCNGIIRPVTDRTEIKSLVSEIIEDIYVTEGQYISKGSPILKLRTNYIDSRIHYLNYQKTETESYINDLEWLSGKCNKKTVFKSLLYQQEYYYFTRQNEELQNKWDKSNREYERNKKLYENGVIAAKEYEDYYYQMKTAKNEIEINGNNFISKWQTDLNKYKSSLCEINSNLEQVLKEKDFYLICAPVTGSIEQFTGLYRGSTLRAGETVAVISPDSTLISEVFVASRDIGYIKNSDPAIIQVDAFNYNEWGTLQGNIRNISADFFLLNNIPMFKVQCKIDKNFLSLPNGLKGYLKKGMTVQARFRIAERSLLQILYQHADDWINPARKSESSKEK
jgi:membrane fusion protein, peptide pheromone/bacteriocin exporter